MPNGLQRERSHDNCASNCTEPWLERDPLAHCPRCCPHDDHILIWDDHLMATYLGPVPVSRWGHRSDPKPFSMAKFPKVW